MIRQFTSKNQQLGQQGEEKAVIFLMKQGFEVLERNVNNKHGEIDIVAKKHGIYHFFEVKTGKQGSWFNPADNLTRDKLWKFHHAVEYYCFKKIKTYKVQGIIVLLPQDSGANFARGFVAPKEAAIEIIDLS